MEDVLFWLLIAAGVIGGVIVVIVVIGSFLPRRHEVARSLETSQPPEHVWQIITDYAAVPSWNTNVKTVERLADHNNHPVWRETYQGNFGLTLAITEAVPPRRLVREIADAKAPFSGRWIFEIVPAEGGCAITITEQGEVPNPLFRFMARSFMDPAKHLEMYLRALASRLGEPSVR